MEKGRRSFLKNSLLGASSLIFAPNIISCATDLHEDQAITNFLNKDALNFDHGIASFDPTDSQLIIWTRYESSLSIVNLEWQLSTNPDFTDIVRYGRITTDASRDYTIAVEIQELSENQLLYYRFIELISRSVSEIGETRTFSKTTVNELKLGVTSCSNYELGYFNVYKEMANSDIDIVVHLGDYIYEQSASSFGETVATLTLDRKHRPENELVSIEDYRTRYKQYRTDEHLKLLHQKKPFICVWDDHEIVNDAYKFGAGNHQEDEGDFEARKQRAIQVYSEFLPFTTTDESVIYRTFNFGNLVQLTLLDTRIAGRDKQLNYADYYSIDGSLNELSFRQDWLDQTRTILGVNQKKWFFNELTNSSAEWLIIGQQVLMGKMYYPLELVMQLNQLSLERSQNGSISIETLEKLQNQLFELVQIKLRLIAMDPTVSEIDKLRVTNVLPYNLDSWDGYPTEREEILILIEAKKTIVLAGDSHNAWHNEILKNEGSLVINEFATSSVTSPGFEYLLEDAGQRQNFQIAITALVDQLSYFNSSDRGFIKLSIQPGQAISEWIMVTSILDKESTITVDNSASI